jgi:amylosucrase
MCGVEAALEAQDADKLNEAIERILMLHAYMFTQSGIPVLYSGDEIGQLNDNEYTLVPEKAPDSRYIHRGKFQWDMAEKVKESGSVQERLFEGLRKLENIRKMENVFMTSADCYTVDVDNHAILAISREFAGEKMIGIFNFSREDVTIVLDEVGQTYMDLLSEQKEIISELTVKGNGFFWLKQV